MRVNVLYFASLAETLGMQSEALTLPTAVATMGQLQSYLAQRGEPWPAVSHEDIRMACNHNLCKSNQQISEGDELAFFPPVTGG